MDNLLLQSETHSDRGRSRAAPHDRGASEEPGQAIVRSGQVRAAPRTSRLRRSSPMRYRLACSPYVIIAEQRMLSIANRPLRIR
jgi:hypothetical protein